MGKKPFLIIQAGSFAAGLPEILERHGDMDALFLKASGFGSGEAHVHRAFDLGRPTSPPSEFAGILITGSAEMVSAPESWMDETADWLRGAVTDEVPTFGICFGHQLLAYALGGRIAANPKGLEAGTTQVTFSPDCRDEPLFQVLPQRALFQVHHYESVIELPPGTNVFGWNEHEPYHAVRYAPRAWGVQFHPEIGADIMRAIFDLKTAEGAPAHVPSNALDEVRDSPLGPKLLQHFKALASGS